LKNRLLICASLLLFVSCTRRIRELIFTNDDITVSKYEISEITTVHDFVEVRNGSKTITVFEASSHGFADIVFKRDTIVIQYLPIRPYKLLDSAFGYKIKFDTAISIEYWQQKMKERENNGTFGAIQSGLTFPKKLHQPIR
jgi:hypothetical protein